MESSLRRSLRSLFAAAALLMAAYAIAASPDGVWSGAPAAPSAAWLSPLAMVKQELGFGASRRPEATAGTDAHPDDSKDPVDSKLAWVFAAVCLVCAMAQRRFVDR